MYGLQCLLYVSKGKCLVPVMKHGVFTKQKASFQYSELLKSRQIFQALSALLSSLTVLSPLIIPLTYSKLHV